MQNSTKWYKGITHSHSDLSDGNSAPEFIVRWYKEHGYNFLAISDHNMFDRGLFEHLSKTYNTHDRFLMLPGEEITTRVNDRELHMNVINITSVLDPILRENIVSTIKANLLNVQQQAKESERQILVHINHPDWDDYSISPEEIARVSDVRFVEIANCLGSVNHYGNSFEGGMEKYWDIINTVRLTSTNGLPIFGMASDDAHDYEEFNPALANPGRGWMMVRSDSLSADKLLNSLQRGDFYCTTGVILNTLDFDPHTGILNIAVEPERDVSYTIDFVGTPGGADANKAADGSYSADIGEVFSSIRGASASYSYKQNYLYIRAHIRSSKKIKVPFWGEGQCEEAWTQPVIKKVQSG